MSWSVEWHPAAEADLLRLHWCEAERVARAVARFAELGLGDVQRVPDEVGLFRLRVSKSSALFSVNRSTRVLLLWRVLVAHR